MNSKEKTLVSGTIGQPDAGTMSGGNFTVTGGFWSLLSAVQMPGAPELTIHLTTTNTVVVSWSVTSPAYTLQHSPALNAPSWGGVTNVPALVGGQYQVIIAPPSGNAFFRLSYP